MRQPIFSLTLNALHRHVLFTCAMILLCAMPLQAQPAPQSQTRIIQHSQGETRIYGTPERIVTLFQGANDTAIALGITPVGVVDAWAQGSNYDYLDTALEGVPHVGLETQPNLEAIAMLQPDLIIASKRRHEGIYDQLSLIAPTISLETVFDIHETLRLMGRALNRESQAEQLWIHWQQRLATFRDTAREKLGERWPMSVTVLNFRADHARIYLDGSYAGTILHDLGFQRPAAHPKDNWVMKLTTRESIPVIDADIIFYFMKDSQAVQDNFEAWTRHPLWHNLYAVKEGHVYPIDRVDWSLAGGILSANRMLDQLFHHFGLDKHQ